MPKPEWKNAPGWAKWLAQDYYGEWYWYAHKPKISDSSAMWMAYCGFSLTGFLQDHRIMHYSQYYKNVPEQDVNTGKIKTYSQYAGYTPPEYPYNDNWKNTLEKRPIVIFAKQIKEKKMAIFIDTWKKILENYPKLPQKFTEKEFVEIVGISITTFYKIRKQISVSSGNFYEKLPDWENNIQIKVSKFRNHADVSILGGEVRRNFCHNEFVKILEKLPEIFTSSDFAEITGLTISYAGRKLTFYLKYKYYDIVNKEGRKKGKQIIYQKTNKEITMPKITELKPPQPQAAIIPQIISEFKSLSNPDKIDFICTLFPFMEKANVTAKINERYPNYIFAELANNDKLFHPIVGNVEIFDVTETGFKFYGNGTKWESDRNGHLIMNGKTDAKRTVFNDLNDYVKYMNAAGDKNQHEKCKK